MLHVSAAMVEKIRNFEGYLPVAVSREGHLYAGFGHSRGVSATTTCDPIHAELWLEDDLATVQDALQRLLAGAAPALRLSQGHWDALVSLTFNLAGGPLALPTVAPKLWKALLARNFRVAAQEFKDICKDAEGHVLEGLKARRAIEARVFLSEFKPTGVY
jgi:GH24 family phage-related lysozyme (muramidase)